MTKKVTLKHKLPCGAVETRTTARTYTHVVIVRRDLRAIREDAAKLRSVDVSNFEHYQLQIAQGVGAPTRLADGSLLNGYPVTQAAYDRAVAEIEGCDSAQQYAEKCIAARLAKHDAEHGTRAVGDWYIAGWCGRADLAEKLASKERNSGWCVAEAIPVAINHGELQQEAAPAIAQEAEEPAAAGAESQESAPAQAAEPAVWKPTQAECDLIKQAAALESMPRVSVGALRLEPGIRYSLTPGNNRQSMNIATLTDREDWEDTDLADFATWQQFREGVPLTEDGRAIVDFYIRPRSGDDLLGNVVAIYEGGRLVAIHGCGRSGRDYLAWLAKGSR